MVKAFPAKPSKRFQRLADTLPDAAAALARHGLTVVVAESDYSAPELVIRERSGNVAARWRWHDGIVTINNVPAEHCENWPELFAVVDDYQLGGRVRRGAA